MKFEHQLSEYVSGIRLCKYDLKKNNPTMNYEDIAKEVYPKDYDNSLGLKPAIDYWSLMQRVKREYRQAKQLVNGDYRQIR